MNISIRVQNIEPLFQGTKPMSSVVHAASVIPLEGFRDDDSSTGFRDTSASNAEVWSEVVQMDVYQGLHIDRWIGLSFRKPAI